MAFSLIFNALSGQFDYVGGGSTTYLPGVQSEVNLPSGDPDGAVRVVRDTDKLYVYDSTNDQWQDSGVTTGTFEALSTAKGVSLTQVVDGSIVRPTISLHAADDTNPGAVSTVAQDFAGEKTFLADAIFEQDVTVNGSVVVDVDLTASGSVLTPVLDSTLPGETLAIGIANADIINIGRSGVTINMIGDTIYQQVTNLEVEDKEITVNSGGAVGSASDTGIAFEENGVITGYVKTSPDRAKIALKAPATAGIANIVPGASGITLDQDSHDPVTLGTANGLGLSTQVLSLGLATSLLPGALSAADYIYFDAKVDTVNGVGGNNPVLSTSDIGEGSNLYFTDERAQDAIGTILVDSATVELAYDDGTPNITANVIDGSITDVKLDTGINANKLADGSVSNAEFQYLDGVTSAIQDQLDSKVETVNGVGGLNPVLTTSDINEGTNLYYTDERAQDSIGTILVDTATIELIYDDGTPSITANVLDNSITDDKLTTGINADKIANGTVTNIEYQYLDGVTSSIQDQLDDKVEIISGDILRTSFASTTSGTPASITGATFDNTVRSFMMTIDVLDSSDFATYTINGIRRTSDWIISQNSSGDEVGISFSITAGGQLQYISNADYTLLFKAETVGT